VNWRVIDLKIAKRGWTSEFATTPLNQSLRIPRVARPQRSQDLLSGWVDRV
jgi:hypothetical protein